MSLAEWQHYKMKTRQRNLKCGICYACSSHCIILTTLSFSKKNSPYILVLSVFYFTSIPSFSAAASLLQHLTHYHHSCYLLLILVKKIDIEKKSLLNSLTFFYFFLFSFVLLPLISPVLNNIFYMYISVDLFLIIFLQTRIQFLASYSVFLYLFSFW